MACAARGRAIRREAPRLFDWRRRDQRRHVARARARTRARGRAVSSSREGGPRGERDCSRRAAARWPNGGRGGGGTPHRGAAEAAAEAWRRRRESDTRRPQDGGERREARGARREARHAPDREAARVARRDVLVRVDHRRRRQVVDDPVVVILLVDRVLELRPRRTVRATPPPSARVRRRRRRNNAHRENKTTSKRRRTPSRCPSGPGAEHTKESGKARRASSEQPAPARLRHSGERPCEAASSGGPAVFTAITSPAAAAAHLQHVLVAELDLAENLAVPAHGEAHDALFTGCLHWGWRHVDTLAQAVPNHGGRSQNHAARVLVARRVERFALGRRSQTTAGGSKKTTKKQHTYSSRFM